MSPKPPYPETKRPLNVSEAGFCLYSNIRTLECAEALTDHHFIRIDPERGAFRFYALSLWPDLFGGVSLAREWGRIGQPGKLRLDHFEDEEQAGRAIRRLAASKRRRGYRQPGEVA